MKNTLLLIAAVLAPALPGFSQDPKFFSEEPKLPRGADELAQNLAKWEAEAKANLEKQIEAKRIQVVAALQGHLEVATKAGNLDDAIAIRKYIYSISPITPVSEWIDGTSWVIKRQGAQNGELKFTRGKVEIEWENGDKNSFQYETPNESTISYKTGFGNNIATLIFDITEENAVYTDRRKVRGTLERIRP